MENYDKRINKDYVETDLDRFVVISGTCFAWIFIFEFCVKVVAQGFVLNRKSYLREYWNMLDFLIVIISVMEIAQLNDSSFSLLRTLRLLKPLRSMKALKTLRVLIQLLFASLAGLVNVFLFLALFFSIFAVLGLNLFCGNQYYACRSTSDIIYPTDGSDPYWPMLDDYNHLCYENE